MVAAKEFDSSLVGSQEATATKSNQTSLVIVGIIIFYLQ